jgi:UDP-N-acetylmuramoylalanine--D-glutamate ligase
MGMENKLDLKLPTAIVGLGLTGQSVLRLLTICGIDRNQIFLFDSKDPSAEYREAESLLRQNPKSLIVSPGVPLSLPWIQQFRANGGQITSELTLATSLLSDEKVIGITGSIGKSTCTSLLKAGLERFSPQSFVGGNLGFPLADYVAQKIGGGPKAEWVVLELSSYQLENYENLECAGSILTYLTPNHMERYPNLDAYYETKWTLVEKTKGPVVLNKNGGDLFKFASRKKTSVLWSDPNDSEFSKVDFNRAKLVGDHNRDNLAMVLKLARQLGWPDSAEAGFFDFPGLPHRLENLGVIDGVRWINDSKATTMESVLQAVRSTASLTSQKMHLLLGGKDKNLPWQDLAPLASSSRRFYFFGEVREKAQALSGLPGETHPHLKEAIASVRKAAKPGDLVLFSPGGTSWDEFKSFEERGDFFRNQISKR